MTLDEKHDDTRRRIRDSGASSEDHLLAGLKGLGLGLWGGASSLVVQPIQGASNEGVWVSTAAGTASGGDVGCVDGCGGEFAR